LNETRGFEINENEFSEPPRMQIQAFVGTVNFIQLIASQY